MVGVGYSVTETSIPIFSFDEKTVSANTHQDMLQLYADGTIYQQDGAPPDLANILRQSEKDHCASHGLPDYQNQRHMIIFPAGVC